MLAAQCQALEGPAGIHVADVAPRELGSDDIRVAVECAAVNFVDYLMTKGQYQVRPPLPFIPGNDVAGIITEVGDKVEGYAKGDRVSVSVSTGGFAEEMVAPAKRAVKVPDNVTMRDAAAYRMSYGTALYALRVRANVQKGESLVVTGAAGGVGIAMLQVGKLLGAQVIGIVDSEEKAEMVRAEGAIAIIEPDLSKLRDPILSLVSDGFDVAIDTIGGPGFQELVRAAGWGSRILILGFVAGIPEIQISRVLLRGTALIGVNYGAGQDWDLAVNADIHRQLMDWLADGSIAPPIMAEFPLAETRTALELLTKRNKTGKILIRVR